MIQLELKQYKKKTIKEQAMEVIENTGKPLAAHEFRDYGIMTNDNCMSSRLNELEREGKLESRFRQGKRFKEWYVEK